VIFDDGVKTCEIMSDYDPDTFLRLTRTNDGDIVVTIFGDGEFRIATSGGRLHEYKLVKVVGLFSKIIDIFNA
jgi:hypothetical protein